MVVAPMTGVPNLVSSIKFSETELATAFSLWTRLRDGDEQGVSRELTAPDALPED